MTDAMTALERLISPHTVDEFLARYFEQTFLHVRRDANPLADYLAGLISFDDLDLLLTTICSAGPQRWDAVRLSQNGTEILPGEYQGSRYGPFAEYDVARMLSLYRNGATIILNAVERTVPAVADFCNDLAEFFGVPVSANVYVTPPRGHGFAAHHDSHDVFLLQVTGHKDWKLYGSPVPLRTSQNRAEARHGAVRPEAELRLRAGEVLYLPRGLVHEGAASEETSFHVTIGVRPYTWALLLADAAAELQEEELALRRLVAPRLAAATEPSMRPAVAETAARLSERLAERLRDSDLVFRLIANRVADTPSQHRPPLRGRFNRLVAPPPIDPATVLRLSPEEKGVSMQASGEEVVVTAREKVLTFPGFVEPHLRALLGGPPTCAAALPRDLDEAGRLVLVRRLADEGLLEVVDAG